MPLLSMEVSFRFGKDYQIGIYFTGVSGGGLFKTLCPPEEHMVKQISCDSISTSWHFEKNQYFFHKFITNKSTKSCTVLFIVQQAALSNK